MAISTLEAVIRLNQNCKNEMTSEIASEMEPLVAEKTAVWYKRNVTPGLQPFRLALL